jgi:hypothetical protein
VALEYKYDGMRRLRRVTEYQDWPNNSRVRVFELSYDERDSPAVFVVQDSGPSQPS